MRKPYNPNNLTLQPYPHWKVIALAWTGKILGVQFKIDGMPFGGAFNKRPDYAERVTERSGSISGSALGPTKSE